MRGFVIERNDEGDMDEDGNESLRFQIRQEMIQKLASEWNDAHRRIEERSWRDQDELEIEDEYHAEQVRDCVSAAKEEALENNPNLTNEELQEIAQKAEAIYYAEVDKKKRIDHERLSVIEELLGELGARMMRPYEHWNEDEKYMEYMETRHDNC
jgi:hypothetical protein